MMGKYHQPYSEIRKMPASLVKYLVAIAKEEAKKQKRELDKLKSKIKR